MQAQHAARLLLLSLHSEGSAAERPQRVLAAQPRAKDGKQTLQTLAAADFGRRLIHRGRAGSTPVTQDARTASAPPQCLLCTRPPVRHEPVGFVGEVSGLEGKTIFCSLLLQLQPSASRFAKVTVPEQHRGASTRARQAAVVA